MIYIYMSKGIKNTNTTKYPNPNCIKNTKSSLWIPKGYPKDIISVHLSLDHGIIILYGCGKVTTSQPSHSQVFVASTLLSWVHLCLNTCTNDWASAGFWRANWRIESLEAIVEAERYICPNVPPPFSSSFSLFKKKQLHYFSFFCGSYSTTLFKMPCTFSFEFGDYSHLMMVNRVTSEVKQSRICV